MTTARHPRYQKKSDRMMHPGATAAEIRCDHACAPLDRIARDMEAIWGIDVLPSLVSPTMAEKYGRAIAHLHASYDASNPADTAAAAENCIKGLQAMDAAARAAGHVPTAPAIWWTEEQGKRIGIVQSSADQARAMDANPGAHIFTAREAAVALRPAAFGLVDEIKRTFPGAEVSAIRKPTQLETELEDEIPW